MEQIMFFACDVHLKTVFFEEFEDYKTGQATRTAKYGNDVVVLAKEQNILQGIIDRLTETG
jgi:hypothetical protein